MGYLSQKKKYNRIKEILNAFLFLIIVALLTLFVWKDSLLGDFISQWLFQFYILMILIAILSAYYRFYGYSFCIFISAFILFLYIGMGGNLLFNFTTTGQQSLSIIYQTRSEQLNDITLQINKHNIDFAGLIKEKSKNFSGYIGELNPSATLADSHLILTPHNINKSGEVLLSQTLTAGFADISKQQERFVFISLDFSNASKKELKIALKNLSEFINMQDIPVIVIGDFGIEAWSPEMLIFMEKTGLSVKNSVILNKGTGFINPLNTPTINLLAYKDFGIKKISFLKAKKNKHKPLLIELNY